MGDTLNAGQGYDEMVSGFSPLSLYMRWYLRHRPAKEAPLVLAQLGPGPFSRLLDVGCGAGIWLQRCWELGHGREMLAGVDLSELLVADARKRLARALPEGAPVRVELASATELPFEDASFEAVMSNGMVKHLDDDGLNAFLAEARRVLVPGGRLSVWDFGRMTIKDPGIDIGGPTMARENVHMRQSEALMAALRDAGFSDVTPFQLPKLRRLPVTFEGAAGTRL